MFNTGHLRQIMIHLEMPRLKIIRSVHEFLDVWHKTLTTYANMTMYNTATKVKAYDCNAYDT